MMVLCWFYDGHSPLVPSLYIKISKADHAFTKNYAFTTPSLCKIWRRYETWKWEMKDDVRNMKLRWCSKMWVRTAHFSSFVTMYLSWCHEVILFFESHIISRSKLRWWKMMWKVWSKMVFEDIIDLEWNISRVMKQPNAKSHYFSKQAKTMLKDVRIKCISRMIRILKQVHSA